MGVVICNGLRRILFPLVCIIGVVLSSCKSDDDAVEPHADGTFEPTSDISLKLEWTHEGSYSQGLESAELDVYILREGEVVNSSEGLDALDKRVRLSRFLEQGVYEIGIRHDYMIVESVDYQLIVSNDLNTHNASGPYHVDDVYDEYAYNEPEEEEDNSTEEEKPEYKIIYVIEKVEHGFRLREPEE